MSELQTLVERIQGLVEVGSGALFSAREVELLLVLLEHLCSEAIGEV